MLELTGPAAPMMNVVQLNHLGGRWPSGRNRRARCPTDAGFLLRLLSPLDGTDVASVRALYGEVSGVLGPRVLGRSLNFCFGGGDRTAGFHEPERRRGSPVWSPSTIRRASSGVLYEG